jgi:hypothetical protein
VRGLIEDDGTGFLTEERDTGLAPFFVGEETFKDEGFDRQPRNDKSRYKGSRSGKTLYTEASQDTFEDEEMSGIGDTGRPGIGDECRPLTGLNPVGKQLKIPLFVKLMVGKHTGLYTVMFEKNGSGARIFGEDKVYGGKGTQGAEGDVVHIPDRRRDDRKGRLRGRGGNFHTSV